MSVNRIIGVAVVAMVALLLAGCGDSSSDAGSRDPGASAATTPGATTTTQGDTAPPGGERAGEHPLVIAVQQAGAMGVPGAVMLESLGPMQVGDSLPGVADAVEAFGEPQSRELQERVSCRLHWPELGLHAWFLQRHAQDPDPCAEGSLELVWATGDRWQTERGVGVGSRRPEVREAYPEAEARPLPGRLPQIVGSPQALQLEEGAYGGDSFGLLYAVLENGSVSSLLYVSGAD